MSCHHLEEARTAPATSGRGRPSADGTSVRRWARALLRLAWAISAVAWAVFVKGVAAQTSSTTTTTTTTMTTTTTSTTTTEPPQTSSPPSVVTSPPPTREPDTVIVETIEEETTTTTSTTTLEVSSTTAPTTSTTTTTAPAATTTTTLAETTSAKTVDDPAEERLRWLSLGLFGLAGLVVVATGGFWVATSPRRRTARDEVNAMYLPPDPNDIDRLDDEYGDDGSGEYDGYRDDGDYDGDDGDYDDYVHGSVVPGSDDVGGADDHADRFGAPDGTAFDRAEARPVARVGHGDLAVAGEPPRALGGRWADADVPSPTVDAGVASTTPPREFDGWWADEGRP